MYKTREEILEIEHKLLRQLVDRMTEEPVDADAAVLTAAVRPDAIHPVTPLYTTLSQPLLLPRY